MAVHEESECPYRPVTCEHCGFETEAQALSTHLSACSSVPLTCQLCRKTILQGQMKRHLERDCEGKAHICPFSPQGCTVQDLTPAELKTHLREDAADHLELMQSDHALSMKLLENRFHKQIAIKDAEIEDLKRTNRNRYRFMWNVEWKHVPGNTTNVRAYTSEKFDIFGRTFYLALWPIGEPQDSEFSAMPSDDPYWASNLPDNITIQPLQGESPNPSRRTSISAPSELNPLQGTHAASSPPIAIGGANSFRSAQGGGSTLSTPSQSPMSIPPMGASPKSLSQRIFEGLRSFTRQRSRDVVSTSPPAFSSGSSTGQGSASQSRSSSLLEPQSSGEQVGVAQTGPTTWVAIYLMMDPESPAPVAALSSPHIYSPVSGLVRASGVGDWGNADIQPTSLSSLSSPVHSLNTRQNAYAAYHDLTRSLNVSVGGQGEAQAVRAPESMVLEYTLRMVNNSPLLSKSAYFETTFPVTHGSGWGEERFIETSQVSRSSGFLSPNNMLLVQCDIQVRQCTFEV